MKAAEPSSMNTFILRAAEKIIIRFRLYSEAAPVTAAAFMQLLPFSCTFLHARISGQEIWTDSPPRLDIIQENASAFTLPGEVVFGPSKPVRVKTAGCMGIYYGKGKGLDACNIFAKVLDEDMGLLQALGDEIWRFGRQTLIFEKPV